MKFTKDWLQDHLKTNKTEAQIVEKLNQAGAIIHINTDGSIYLNQGCL